MKVYIVQDEGGNVTLFTSEPKLVKTYDGSKHWAIKSGEGLILPLTNTMDCKRFINGKGEVDYIYLADLLGLKRIGWREGTPRYKNIGVRKPRQIELNITLEFLDEFGRKLKGR